MMSRWAAGIRPYTPADAGQVAALYERTFLEDVWIDQERREYYVRFFTSALFDHPWYREDIPSLVQESSDGRVTGFLGVVPKALYLDDRPIRLAVASVYMAEPGSRPGGFALLKRFLGGPQEASMPDGATEPARRIVEGLGFRTYPSRSVDWFRMFRPTRAVLGRLARSATRSHRVFARTAMPATTVMDRLARRLPDLDADLDLADGVRSRPLETAELLECIRAGSIGRRLRPDYDERTLQWMLDFRASARHRGRFERRAVEDERGTLVGWYLGHFQPEGISEIVQIGAVDGRMERVLARALSDYRRRGSAMVYGRLETSLLKPALQNACLFRRAAWACVHGKDPALLDACDADDVFLTPLETDWPW